MDDLTHLLQDAVSDVEPSNRLAELRDRTASRPGRGRWYAAGTAGLAVAAAVTAYAIVSASDHDTADDVGPASPAPTVAVSETPRTSPQAVYFVGDTAVGPRLFREFRPSDDGPSPDAAVEALRRGPWDPDYRSYFPTDAAITGADVRDGVINVTVESWVRNRPTNMTELQAELAVQQVVYTVQAGAGEPLPVQFRIGRNPIDTVFGVPTSEPITNQPQLDVLSHVSISDPVESLQVRDSFIARGAASSFEGNVPWELRDVDDTVVRSGQVTAGQETHLVEWETEPIDVSDLEPGQYTFVATTDDAKFTDTRTVIVL